MPLAALLLLLTKQQDLMVEPGSVNGFELIGPNLSDIYAANLGAERLSSWDDLHAGTPHCAAIVSDSISTP